MASAGTKRPLSPHEDDRSRHGHGESSRSSHHDRKDKPKDWRDAFLDDEPRRRSKDHRVRSREGDYHRSRDDRDPRDERYRRDMDRRGGRYEDDRRGGGDRRGDMSRHYDRDYRGSRRDTTDHHREREHIGGEKVSSRRYGDTRDRRDHDDASVDREDGECVASQYTVESSLMSTTSRIEGSPEKKQHPLPASPSASRDVSKSPRDPRQASSSAQSMSRGNFKSVSIPTGPKGASFSSSMGGISNVFDRRDQRDVGPSNNSSGQSSVPEEPIVTLEEETDPEKILEERRRKREEIMARFKAKTMNAAPSQAASAMDSPSTGNGADSVTTAGMQTAERSGAATGTTTGE
ncbi:hypothetical protein BD324DRAFT_168498 [Kockovaella imperatae]|uniref:Uncharacterized protein n=1 Tax=Kockovaella imperatae TaxID=4999 RepID=A0A1Y1U9F8_9TREE|nr:hypothetical protein BD324DRAFT_168498 [Kockovaella imperatae]ORX34184.1 hypothetical protein BD324DRAFT_168498 [Kockovaella imperatae]